MASIINATTTAGVSVQGDNSGSLQLATNNGTTAVTIDTSQNVGIGTSSPARKLQIHEATAATNAYIQLSNAATGSTSTDGFQLIVGTGGETILAQRENAEMQFWTNNTERMRITSDGTLLIGKTTDDQGTGGAALYSDGSIYSAKSVAANLSTVFLANRITSDGDLFRFLQAGTQEGSISVSGTTVSYNGGHLSRWSQLPDGSKDDTILKGTVMSNLDDMCVWEKEGVVAENEQLNKMKVSDVEGDTNVAGVFVNWTIDEQYGVDDMNVAMTGDMIIRIADGVVVQKGDLLMSAGDGTAKPQGDDIVRSKTIAKVTSNHVTCTYADGSYCVPCVLMAC